MERDHQQPPKHQGNLSQNPNKENAFTASDRLKRDEWSEGAVSCLLEAYEAKWTLRNRAKLKGQDWEDVAKHVSGRASGSKSAKTQTQCKNKIESMKKRYRSESAAAADTSSWPLYSRLDLLLRGNGGGGAAAAAVSNPPPVVVMVEELTPPVVMEVGSGGGPRLQDGYMMQEEGDGPKKAAGNEENPIEEADSSSNTPAVDDFHTKAKAKAEMCMKRKRKEKWRKQEYWGEWLAEVLVRSEEARMETWREIERIRAEAETKRGEMELKRTEIIANTQLQIAKLFATHQEWKKQPS